MPQFNSTSGDDTGEVKRHKRYRANSTGLLLGSLYAFAARSSNRKGLDKKARTHAARSSYRTGFDKKTRTQSFDVERSQQFLESAEKLSHDKIIHSDKSSGHKLIAENIKALINSTEKITKRINTLMVDDNEKTFLDNKTYCRLDANRTMLESIRQKLTPQITIEQLANNQKFIACFDQEIAYIERYKRCHDKIATLRQKARASKITQIIDLITKLNNKKCKIELDVNWDALPVLENEINQHELLLRSVAGNREKLKKIIRHNKKFAVKLGMKMTVAQLEQYYHDVDSCSTLEDFSSLLTALESNEKRLLDVARSKVRKKVEQQLARASKWDVNDLDKDMLTIKNGINEADDELLLDYLQSLNDIKFKLDELIRSKLIKKLIILKGHVKEYELKNSFTIAINDDFIQRIKDRKSNIDSVGQDFETMQSKCKKVIALIKQVEEKKKAIAKSGYFAVLLKFQDSRIEYLRHVDDNEINMDSKRLALNAADGLTCYQYDRLLSFFNALERYTRSFTSANHSTSVDDKVDTCCMFFGGKTAKKKQSKIPTGIMQLNNMIIEEQRNGGEFDKERFIKLVKRSLEIIRSRQAIWWWNNRSESTSHFYACQVSLLDDLLQNLSSRARSQSTSFTSLERLTQPESPEDVFEKIKQKRANTTTLTRSPHKRNVR